MCIAQNKNEKNNKLNNIKKLNLNTLTFEHKHVSLK